MRNLLISVLSLLFLANTIGQELPPVTQKVMIDNIFIHASPSAIPYLGDILIENGMIVEVGPSINLPFDAKMIDGDSMHVYAGFIAALSHIGLKEPKEDSDRPKVERTGYPPNDVAGITPEKSIADLYNQKDGSITGFRKQGFTIAHSVPHGKMMPGMGSIISLNSKSFEEAVISQDQSLYAQWKTSRGVFPGTLIGIMSKWREMYRNAEILEKYSTTYKRNPSNRQRPTIDAATAALFPIVRKQMPVFFTAEKHRDIHRTLQLKKELGFDLVIGEVRDVDRVLRQVQASGAKVLLSLDLPDAEKKSEEDDKEDTAKTKIELQKEHFSKRKEEAVARYVAQAKIMSEQGIPVAFSFLESKPGDIHKNLKRLVKDGLSEADALGSLTTEPAKTLGISTIAGTLEGGKMGNLVVTTKPLFDEQSKIKMVIIDGTIHKYEIKEKKKKSGATKEIDVSGEWSYKIEVPGMTPSGTMTFTKNGESYDMTATNNQTPGESITTEGIEMSNNTMEFAYTVDAGGMSITLDNEITFDGETFEGSVSVGDFGSFEITGSKITPEE